MGDRLLQLTLAGLLTFFVTAPASAQTHPCVGELDRAKASSAVTRTAGLTQ
jgi:hypothetical protein